VSAIYYFEIPTSDIQRAKRFYDTIMDIDIQVMDLTESMGGLMGMFPDRGGVMGSIVQNAKYEYVPSKEGSLVYLVVDYIDASLAKVEEAGGKILLPKTDLGDMDPGFTAWVEDTEGNRVGLYGS
jgi:predicted enzyme related to lactoylglutathione lyase